MSCVRTVTHLTCKQKHTCDIQTSRSHYYIYTEHSELICCKSQRNIQRVPHVYRTYRMADGPSLPAIIPGSPSRSDCERLVQSALRSILRHTMPTIAHAVALCIFSYCYALVKGLHSRALHLVWRGILAFHMHTLPVGVQRTVTSMTRICTLLETIVTGAGVSIGRR